MEILYVVGGVALLAVILLVVGLSRGSSGDALGEEAGIVPSVAVGRRIVMARSRPARIASLARRSIEPSRDAVSPRTWRLSWPKLTSSGRWASFLSDGRSSARCPQDPLVPPGASCGSSCRHRVVLPPRILTGDAGKRLSEFNGRLSTCCPHCQLAAVHQYDSGRRAVLDGRLIHSVRSAGCRPAPVRPFYDTAMADPVAVDNSIDMDLILHGVEATRP